VITVIDFVEKLNCSGVPDRVTANAPWRFDPSPYSIEKASLSKIGEAFLFHGNP